MEDDPSIFPAVKHQDKTLAHNLEVGSLRVNFFSTLSQDHCLGMMRSLGDPEK